MPASSLPSATDHLLVADGTAVHHVFPLTRTVTHVGRGAGADLHLDEHTVSRRHALLVRTREGVRLIDDRSANGTLVNGEEVTDAVLRDGDVVRLGRATLTYCAGPAAPAAAAAQNTGTSV